MSWDMTSEWLDALGVFLKRRIHNRNVAMETSWKAA